ncbi:MAG: ATP-binding protein, partial [Alphaproteobacteria bacterium]
MQSRAYTVAFEGPQARLVEVQCAVAPGLPAFTIVGLANKAVSEARERVRAALAAMSIALPPRRITINLAPAAMPKEGSHFDLPIALALLAATGVVPGDALGGVLAIGELSLDGALVAVAGALPAALAAAERRLGFICPAAVGPEAAWVGDTSVHGPRTLLEAVHHLSGKTPLPAVRPAPPATAETSPDMADVRGQEGARRAIEIAAAGRHHILMVGAPGAGKSMLAARLPGLLPPMSPAEMLETTMLHSLAGLVAERGITAARPFRAPHHSASVAALVGGGRRSAPGEISLAHNGVLFLDELPEFPRNVLETLRQPMESGEVTVSRAEVRATYPARFLCVAAANPCRCGHLFDPGRACARAPGCGADYLGRISGPLMDRFDIRLEVPPVDIETLDATPGGEDSATIAARVSAARAVQSARLGPARTNADLQGNALREAAEPDAEGRDLVRRFAERFGLSARGHARILRVARTIADLAGEDRVRAPHVAEALGY